MNHTFTSSSPQIIIPITTPFNISFTLTPPPDFHPTLGVATRLLHVRTHEGKPKLTEIFELKVSGNGQLVCELSGYGNKQPQYIPPAKFDLPSNDQYTISYNNGVLNINNSVSLSTLLAIANGVTVELCFGFDKSNDELVAPFGWVLETNLESDINPVTPPIVNSPPFNPNIPIPIVPIIPNTQLPTPIPPILPPILPPITSNNPEDQLKKELIQDLTNIAFKYAGAKGIDPMVILLIQALLTRID